MDNFWNDGKEIIKGSEEIEVSGGGGGLLPIPENTQVKIGIAEAKWETNDREGTFISLKHQVTAPACYKGRIIFQKLHVNPSDGSENLKLNAEQRQKKKSKALKMLAVIDTNSGGKLSASPERPTDQKLQACLVGKTMMMMLGEYEFDTKDGQRIPNPVDYMRGNWVKKVAPKDRFVEMSKEEQEAAVEQTKQKYNQLLAESGGQRQAPQQQRQPQQQAPQQAVPDFDSFDDDIPF